jgi:hypothetical protein
VRVRSLALVAGVAALVAGTAGPAQAATSFGFTTSTRNTIQKVTCAIGLPWSPRTLICSSPAIKKHAYDHLGVVELPLSGAARIGHSGNDMLLGIDGLLPRSYERRPLLRSGATWSRGGYRCSNRAGTVSCTRGGHGFEVSPLRVRTF